MAEEAPDRASIISIIREMIKAGESEESIVRSLKELGIKEKDAKKLLLLGEADTFSLLQNEINKMVKEYYDKEKPQIAQYIRDEVEKQEDEMTDKVEKRALGAFKEDQKFIENQATMFQARVNQSVKNIMQLNEHTKNSMGQLGNRISNNERELWGIKDRVYGSKVIRVVSMVLITLEFVLVIATAIMFFSNIQTVSFETAVIAVAIGAILATMIFLIRLRI